MESDIWRRRRPPVIALLKFNDAIKEWVSKQGDAIRRDGGRVQLTSIQQLMEVFDLAKSFGISEEQLRKLHFWHSFAFEMYAIANIKLGDLNFAGEYTCQICLKKGEKWSVVMENRLDVYEELKQVKTYDHDTDLGKVVYAFKCCGSCAASYKSHKHMVRACKDE